MAEEFDVACPKCSIVFTVSRDLCGEMAECSECGSVFEVPFPEEVRSLESTETGAIQGVAAAPEAVEATNTVKLSRTGIGMIPTLKDSFEFGTKAPGAQQQMGTGSKFALPSSGAMPPKSSPQPPAGQQPVAPSKTGMTFKKPPMQAPQSRPAAPQPHAPPPPQAQAPVPQQHANISQTQTAAAPAPHPHVQLPSWAKIVVHKDEEVHACREAASNPIGMALLTALPPLLCVSAAFLPSPISIAVCVVLALAAFAAAFVVLKKSSRKLVVLTSQRAISVSGAEIIEAKR